MWFPVLHYTVTVDLKKVTSIGLSLAVSCCIMWQNIDTVAELNEYDNEGRLNKMVRDDKEELRLSNSEGERGN